ncbi:MAG: dihydropteroate synthase [Acidobacteriales bacterium]|nr:dihydropteroate synthase [Terriglobales bacterium]
MGIVNVTPDSFSDGGEYFHADVAAQRALELFQEGADIVDVGGESTRPGSYERITTEEEMRRVIPVIKLILRERPDAIVSVDTYRAETARRAAEAGAEIVNDVSGLTWGEGMAECIAETGAGCVLMHSRGRPEEWKGLPRFHGAEVVRDVVRGLSGSVAAARNAGVAREAIAIDPGLGFGKRFEENYPLLARMEDVVALGYPVVSGASRKSFLGRTIGERVGKKEVPVKERLNGTTAADVAAILRGAHIIRVHEVKPAVEAAAIADAILAASDGL